MTNLLSLIHSTRGEPTPLARLWHECTVLRRNGTTGLPETQGQFNEEVRALERAGVVTMVPVELDGRKVDGVLFLGEREPAKQATLF